ncbi:TPA: SGNH/GDSL hydrolase family protein, partial [Klebsiella aerogenes]
GGEPLDTWREMMAKNDEVRQNIIPLSKQYMTLAAAQADIANIPVGSTTYYRSPDNSLLAIEVMNVSGTLQPTGRVMGGNASLMAPNLITNSRAADSDALPVMFSFGATKWSVAGSQMAALGAVQSVLCTPRASTADPAVNWLFQQDISFVSGGSFIATEFLFRGNTSLIFTRVVPDAAATRLSQDVADLGNGTYRVSTVWSVNGVDAAPATVIYFGCQQRGDSVDNCEVAYPKLAISKRRIIGIGGDMTPADLANINGVIAPNLIYNSYADPRYQMPRVRVGSVNWTLVSTITDSVAAAALTAAGAVSCLVAPPVSSSYVDALVEPLVDETATPGMWGAAQYYVYVSPLNGADPKTEITKSAVFFIDVDGAFQQVTPSVIKRVSANLFLVRATYQFTTKPRRIALGVRQTSANSTQYVFGAFMGLSVQKIRDVMQSPVRDASLGERIDGNARNIAFNPSADPLLQQQPLFGTSNAWAPVANLPTEVQMISQLGAKAALPALRVAAGATRDALVNVPLDGVKAGEYVRVEFYVYVRADAGVDVITALNRCTAFFWFNGTFGQYTATVKEKVNDNVYIMTYQYQFTQDAQRVYLGVRSNRTDVDYWVFNTKTASSAKPIVNITDGLVRDPLLPSWVDSKIASAVSPYPPLLAVNTPVTSAENYILLPDQVFVPPSAPLILQCHQLLMNWTPNMGQFLDWSVRGTADNGQPYSYETSRTLEIDPSKTGAAVSFGFHDRQKPSQWSRRDVTLVRGPVTLVAAKTIALIGDSLTNRGQVNRVSALLTTAGVTVSQVGTMSQSEGGRGEGREGWAAAHFVGKRNVINSTTITISSDRPSGTNKNPFLFEATVEQKTANPSMCFLNTGAVAEQSYADTQTGVFYTFDYRRYLDAQGFSDPDVVTIALAWNDQAAGQTPDMYIAQINYMVAQIKVACPNVRIAVAPYCHPYSSRAVWNATTSQYVRNVIGSFKGRQAEKLHIIPSWGILPADTAFSSDGVTIVRDALTGSYVDTRSDNIHWDQWGRQYMAYNCLYPFYIWACAQ